jgi:4-amino-4-deoxy-L-arabinose transferase-like glycosyltransferase
MRFSETSDHGMAQRRAFLNALLIAVVTAVVAAVVILSWVPPVSRDALTHHLAVPKLYLQHGAMVELPDVPFSYYPMNLDLLYLVPLWFGNDILPKYIHYVFALLTAGTVFSHLKRRLDVTYALFGALFFLSIPVVVKLSTTVYVDLGLVFFTTAAVIYLLRWAEGGLQWRHLLLSAVFCGLALGTKYNGLVTVGLLVLSVPCLFLHTSQNVELKQGRAVGYGTLYLLVALLVFAPWMIRNMVWTGNPIYPMYNHWFKTGAVDPLPEEERINDLEYKQRAGHWNHYAIRRLIYGESWAKIALLPVRIFFEGQDDKPQYFDGRLNPFLLLLLPFAFLVRNESHPFLRAEKRFLLVFTILFILIAFLRTSIRIRYIAPVIPPLVLLSTYGLKNLIEFFRIRKQSLLRSSGIILVAVMMLWMFTLNAVYIVKLFKTVDPLSYISGTLDRDAYISKYRSEYPVLQYVNRSLTQNAKILGLFMGNRRYYCDRELVFGESLLTRAVMGAESTERIGEMIAKQGFTHMIVRFDLFKQWSGGLDETERKLLVQYFKANTQAILVIGEYGLFEFKSQPVGSASYRHDR